MTEQEHIGHFNSSTENIERINFAYKIILKIFFEYDDLSFYFLVRSGQTE